jgi:mannose-6-phosphate isomerase
MDNIINSTIFGDLCSQSNQLRLWLKDHALPLWCTAGVAPEGGGFYERIGQDGNPITFDKRRARVQPRQVYCFSVAGHEGWGGQWQAATEQGVVWFDKVYRLNSGLYGNLASADGELIDPTFDLYNQAFALFACAAISIAMPEKKAEMRAKALSILDALKQDYKHPVAGFEEASPPKAPLCSNPHMHLFEAMQTWEIIDPLGPWRELTNEIAVLATKEFIDTNTGALREFFDHDWKPMPGEMGRIVEPGHQFEWAWLLARYAGSRQNAEVLAKAVRLFEIGVEHGICPDREVAVMSLNDDFSVRDSLARLWPQTEWLKASLQLAHLSPTNSQEYYLESALAAIKALNKFLGTPIVGLWYDKLPKDAKMVLEPAPASTFYHIVCAILELDSYVKTNLKKSTAQSLC